MPFTPKLFKRARDSLHKKNKYFGAPLEPNTGVVPTVISSAITYLTGYLDESGLFRIPGQVSVMNELKAQWDSGQEVNFSSIPFCHNVAGLLKLFLRELPEPLLTFDLYPDFLHAALEAQPAIRRKQTRALLETLPLTFYASTKEICKFLALIASKSEVNGMNASNLATVFAPNMLRPKVETLEYIVQDTPYINAVVEFLVQDYKYMFEEIREEQPKIDPLTTVQKTLDDYMSNLQELPSSSKTENMEIEDLEDDPVDEQTVVEETQLTTKDQELVEEVRCRGYEVVKHLYDLCDNTMIGICNSKSKEEVIFVAKIVRELRRVGTIPLGQKLNIASFEPPICNTTLEEDIIGSLCKPIVLALEEVKGLVETLAEAISLMNSIPEMVPPAAHLDALLKIIICSARLYGEVPPEESIIRYELLPTSVKEQRAEHERQIKQQEARRQRKQEPKSQQKSQASAPVQGVISATPKQEEDLSPATPRLLSLSIDLLNSVVESISLELTRYTAAPILARPLLPLCQQIKLSIEKPGRSATAMQLMGLAFQNTQTNSNDASDVIELLAELSRSLSWMQTGLGESLPPSVVAHILRKIIMPLMQHDLQEMKLLQ